MWGYMGYGLDGSSGPSIHDIFTGHWTPNAEETAAGFTTPVNAAMGVIASRHQKNPTKNLACSSVLSISTALASAKRTLGDTYFSFASQLGLTVDTSQDISCTNVKVYPEAAGTNKGYFLQYSFTTNQCELTATPTPYHAFRSGDLKMCLKDGENKGNYVKAANDVKSTTIRYTNWQQNYPYIVGSYASATADATKTPLMCLKPIACSTTAVPAVPSDVWGAKAAADVAKTFEWFDPAMSVLPDYVNCALWSSIIERKDFQNINLL